MSHDQTQALKNKRPNRGWEHVEGNFEKSNVFKMIFVCVEINMNANKCSLFECTGPGH